MADRPDKRDTPASLVEQKKEFLESFFERGAEFTRELLRENDRLRHRVAELEEQLRSGYTRPAPEQLDEIERRLAERYAEIERENNALASLYVAQSQLHASLRVGHVVEVILEVLLNFVGAMDFALIEQPAEGAGEPAVLAVHGQVPEGALADPVVRQVLGGGPAHADESAGPGAVRVCFPVRRVDGVGGAVCIWSFLPQKSGVEEIDRRMFDLISESGGLALQAARCFETTEGA